MLPRVSPEATYGPNGEVRYTGVWATRNLGPQHHTGYGPRSVDRSEPSNTYANIAFFLLLAILELCSAVVFTGLGAYHYVEHTKYNTIDAVGIVTAGIPSIAAALCAVIGFYPGKRGRVTKRLVVVFSLPALYALIGAVRSISLKVAIADQRDIFYLCEAGLASFLVLLVLITMYPASEVCIPNEGQRRARVRSAVMAVNVIVGAALLIYLCFSIYGYHVAFETENETLAKPKIIVSIFAISITSPMLLASLGAFYSAANGSKAHMVPYLVMGVVAATAMLLETGTYVELVDSLATDGSYFVYVIMFGLNCLNIAGIAGMISLIIAFACL